MEVQGLDEPRENIVPTPLQAWQRFSAICAEICRPTWGGRPTQPTPDSQPLLLVVEPSSTVLPNASYVDGLDVEMSEIAEIPAPVRRPPPVTVEEVADEDVLAEEQRRAGFRARSRIPWGWIILAEELFDDFPESRIDELRKKAAPQGDTSADADSSSDPAATEDQPTDKARYQPPPCMKEARRAHTDIKKVVLTEMRKKSSGKLLVALQQMQMLLNCYTGGTYGWIEASVHVAQMHEASDYRARQLRAWTRSFIANRQSLPRSNMGTWNISLLDKHPKLG